MNDEAIRLAKRVADSVPCSRAEAERYIAGGWVSIDGVVAEDPAARVTAAQTVALLPGAVADEPLPITLLLNKPAGVDADAALALLSEQTLVEGERQPRFLKRHLAKLTLATPLETASHGLVVFTQDWRVLRKLVEEGRRMEQEFVAEIDAHVDDDALARLQRAIRPGVFLKASRQSEARLRFAGKDIRPGQLQALCEKVGLRMTGLKRLRVGRVALAGLPAGRWRYVPDTERF